MSGVQLVLLSGFESTQSLPCDCEVVTNNEMLVSLKPSGKQIADSLGTEESTRQRTNGHQTYSYLQTQPSRLVLCIEAAFTDILASWVLQKQALNKLTYYPFCEGDSMKVLANNVLV